MFEKGVCLGIMRGILGTAEGGVRVASMQEVIGDRVYIGNGVIIFNYPESFRQCFDTAEFLARKGKRVMR